MTAEWSSFPSERHTEAVAFLIYLFLASVSSAITWKAVSAYLERKRREQDAS